MSWMKHTGCRYHTQDTGWYCGAAAAMMILAEIGVPYSDLDQVDLYTSNHDHNVNAGWATDPYGLRFTLIDRKPAAFHNTFTVFKPTNEAEGTRNIVSTLYTFNVSPAVLVYHCQHWIVVPGVQTDVEPVADYTVEGFWINNPVYEPGAPHDATDSCGSGGVWGNANEFVTYANWQDLYFTGCDYDDPAGDSQFISVCDPNIPEIKLPGRREKKFLASGRRLLVEKQAIEFSQVGLKEYGLFEDERVGPVLQEARPASSRAVLRLDRPNTYYHLTQWKTKEGVVASAQIDARFGVFQGLHLWEKPMRQVFATKESVLKRVSYQPFDLPELQGQIVLDPQVACLSPVLVWQPCWESWSPHLPFYQFTMGDHRIYVRVDGKVFTSLTTTGRGV